MLPGVPSSSPPPRQQQSHLRAGVGTPGSARGSPGSSCTAPKGSTHSQSHCSQSVAGDCAGPAVTRPQLSHWALHPWEKLHWQSGGLGLGGPWEGGMWLSAPCLECPSQQEESWGSWAAVWSGGQSLSGGLPGNHTYPEHGAERLGAGARLILVGRVEPHPWGGCTPAGYPSAHSWERPR